MQIARWLLYWRAKPLLRLLPLALLSVIYESPRQVMANPALASPRPDEATDDGSSARSLPLASGSPSQGSPVIAIHAGATLGNFFSRPLVSGSLGFGGGAMATPNIGVILSARVDIGGLDLRYLLVSSGRVGLGVLGLLSERVTVSGVLGGGFIGFTRNSTGTVEVTQYIAADLSVGVDLLIPAPRPSPARYRASSRLYLPVTVSMLVLPWVRDSGLLAAAAQIGLGYRYR